MKRILQISYAAVLLLHIICRATEVEMLAAISKALLMPLLLVYYLYDTKGTGNTHPSIIVALIFCWIGDVLLLKDNALFFMLGLSAFLIAHIVYTQFFKQYVAEKGWKLFTKDYAATIIIWLYAIVLFTFLLPDLNALVIPVGVYAMVISLMVFMARRMHVALRSQSTLLILSGAICFVISDSLLAINKFSHPFALGNTLVMLTYALAQWLIVSGSIRLKKNTAQ